MTDANRLGELINSDDGGITLAAFEPAEILLAEPRHFLDLLLGQAALAPEACEILTHKLSHVHVDLLAEYAI